MATFEEANDKIQQLNKTTSTYKILNAMLNFDDHKYEGDAAEFEGFIQTRQVVMNHILESKDLEQLSQLYDDYFLLPMRLRDLNTYFDDGQEIYGELDKGEQELWEFEAKVRQRDGNRCVLTGYSDTIPQSNVKRPFNVAHFIPPLLIRDSQSRITVEKFILLLCPWLPRDFFENLDVCENTILLNKGAHHFFGAFEWFVTMDTGIDGNITFRAMQVEENGLLGENNTGRSVIQEFKSRDGIWMNIPITVSSYNQPLFIGDSHPQPGLVYLKLHEMLARIFKMRGHAKYYEIDSDDEYEPVDGRDLIKELCKNQQDSTKTLVAPVSEPFHCSEI